MDGAVILLKIFFAFLSILLDHVSEDLHFRHAELIEDADKNNLKLKVVATPLKDHGVTEVSIYTQDHSGLFARTCAGLALSRPLYKMLE